MPRCDCGLECPCRNRIPKECQAMATRYIWSQSAKRRSSIRDISGPRIVATGDRVSPQKPRRNNPLGRCCTIPCRAVDALCEITRSASLGARLRPPGCGDPNPCHDPQRLHSSWYTAYRDPRLNQSGVRGSPASSRFVQQSRGLGLRPGFLRGVRSKKPLASPTSPILRTTVGLAWPPRATQPKL
jgi:hypothetical protein